MAVGYPNLHLPSFRNSRPRISFSSERERQRHRDREHQYPSIQPSSLTRARGPAQLGDIPSTTTELPQKGRVSAAPVRPPCVHIVISPVCKRMHDMISFHSFSLFLA
ncbi:hypothetical protein V8C40DRAFT_249866 [Trichoderma camerunense]